MVKSPCEFCRCDYLAILLDRFVFDKFSYDGIKEKVKQFCTNLISISTKKIYPDAISYAIYYSLKYQIYLDSITEEELLKIVSLDDCVVNVLLYDYAKKNKLKIIIKEIENRVERLENAIQIEIDRQWLLIYQIWTVKKLNANGQNFLAKLKESKFKFLSIEPPLIDDKLPQGGVKNEDANEFTY